MDKPNIALRDESEEVVSGSCSNRVKKATLGREPEHDDENVHRTDSGSDSESRNSRRPLQDLD